MRKRKKLNTLTLCFPSIFTFKTHYTPTQLFENFTHKAITLSIQPTFDSGTPIPTMPLKDRANKLMGVDVKSAMEHP
jgi:hypothetical protein